MPRPTTGSVTEHVGKDGRTYRSLRFSAYGKRRREPLGPASAEEAATALRHMLADVERGIWSPQSVQPSPEPTAVPASMPSPRNGGCVRAAIGASTRWTTAGVWAPAAILRGLAIG